MSSKAQLRTDKSFKWTVHFHDRKGKHFYYNRDTGKSTVRTCCLSLESMAGLCNVLVISLFAVV
jgi:hypothetical protein